MTNATDLDTGRSASLRYEMAEGAGFKLRSARSRRESTAGDRDELNIYEQDDAVDVVVVDRDFSEVLEVDAGSFGVAGSETAVAPDLDSGGLNGLGIIGKPSSARGVGSREETVTDGHNNANASQSGVSRNHTLASVSSSPVYMLFRWRISPAVAFFFESRFPCVAYIRRKASDD